MSRITELFQRKRQHILNVYCTAGFPSLNSTMDVMKALQESGADMIELGMPYSDPLADGPVIQASGAKALEQGMTIHVLFDQLAALRPAIYEFESEYGAVIRNHGLDFIFLITPETSDERIRKIDELSSGFVYAVSSSSTTGKDKDFGSLQNYFTRIQSLELKNPVLVGFGIRDKAGFEAVSALAAGAIVGSAYIKAIEQAPDLKLATRQFVESLIK